MKHSTKLKILKQPQIIITDKNPTKKNIFISDTEDFYQKGTMWINSEKNRIYFLSSVDEKGASWVFVGGKK